MYRELFQDPEELSPPGGNSSHAILTSSSTAPSAEKARNQTKPTTVDNTSTPKKFKKYNPPVSGVCLFVSPRYPHSLGTPGPSRTPPAHLRTSCGAHLST